MAGIKVKRSKTASKTTGMSTKSGGFAGSGFLKTAKRVVLVPVITVSALIAVAFVGFTTWYCVNKFATNPNNTTGTEASVPQDPSDNVIEGDNNGGIVSSGEYGSEYMPDENFDPTNPVPDDEFEPLPQEPEEPDVEPSDPIEPEEPEEPDLGDGDNGSIWDDPDRIF